MCGGEKERSPNTSIMKPESHLNKNFARVVPVEAAEGLAVVEPHAAVGDIQGVERGRDALAEVFAQRKIEGGVRWQMVSGIGLIDKTVREAGAVIDIRRGVGAPRK